MWQRAEAAATPRAAVGDPHVPGAGCAPYCTERCGDLNGDVAAECGACAGPGYACRPGSGGFPHLATRQVVESERAVAAEPQQADRCHIGSHALRWLLGRLLAADPAMRGPPALLLTAVQRLESLEAGGGGGGRKDEL